MLLVVDIGNTNIVMALHDDTRWINNWRIHSDVKKTADEYLVVIERLLGEHQIDRCVISSVVPKLTKPIKWVVENITKTTALIISHDSAATIKRSSIPPELGFDLLANAEAAHALYPNNTCMVLDLGTALTLTTVNENGEIVGVAIAPGLETSVYALFSNTAQIPAVQLEKPVHVMGRSSEESIQSGIMYGAAGVVKEILRLTEEHLQKEIVVIATGGFSQVLAPLIDRVTLIEPLLTLEGLRIMAAYNTNRP